MNNTLTRTRRSVLAASIAGAVLATSALTETPLSLTPVAEARPYHNILPLTTSIDNFQKNQAYEGLETIAIVDMPETVETGEDIPVTINIDPVTVVGGNFGFIDQPDLARTNDLLFNVGLGVELVNPPEGVSIEAGGVLDIKNYASISDWKGGAGLGSYITVSFKPIELTLKKNSAGTLALRLPLLGTPFLKSTGRQNGVTQLRVDLSSTAGKVLQTTTVVNPNQAPAPDGSSEGTNIGAIVGGVLGALALIAGGVGLYNYARQQGWIR